MNPKERARLRLLQERRERQRQLALMTPEERAAHDQQQLKRALAWNQYLARVRGPGKPQRGDDEFPPWSFADDPSLQLLPGEEFPRTPRNRTPRPVSIDQQLSAVASV